MSDLEKTKRDIAGYEALCARYDEPVQWGVEVNGQRFPDPYGPHAVSLRNRQPMSKLAEKIVEMIERHGPIKAVELPVKLVEEFGLNAFHDWAEGDTETADLIESLIENGRIIEVEYVLPDMDYRAKSLLFPAGAKVRIRQHEPT